METKTIIETTTQVIKENGIYDITVVNTDNVITEIKAVVTAQLRQSDGVGGYILSAQMGTITQSDKGITIDGTIPSDVLPNIISEFSEIISEIKNN